MLSRRHVIGAAAAAAGAAVFFDPTKVMRFLEAAPKDAGKAQDEDFWSRIQRAFTVDRSVVNLNNGGVSPAPAWVQAAQKRHLDHANELPPHVLWREQQPRVEPVRRRFAKAWKTDPEEIAFTRNASESLQICQQGIDLQKGDEVLTTTQDYPRMLTTFDQRARREGIVVKKIKIPVPCEDENEIVKRFEAAITKKTKMILMCHMINLTGQVLPVGEVTRMARTYRIPVIVDGAHAFAHVDFNLEDLGCDYYGTSLHKWLFAPHGTGLLYIHKSLVPNVWPLMAAPEKRRHDIRKFEEIGTHPVAQILASAEALTFHQALGGKRKEQRLIHLRNYWCERLLKHDRVHLNTSLKPGFACGIANARVDGLDTGKLNAWLWNERRILTVGIKHDEVDGLRVSPSAYTTHEELDRFCDAVEHAMKHGLPE